MDYHIKGGMNTVTGHVDWMEVHAGAVYLKGKVKTLVHTGGVIYDQRPSDRVEYRTDHISEEERSRYRRRIAELENRLRKSDAECLNLRKKLNSSSNGLPEDDVLVAKIEHLQIELDNNTPPPPIYADEILDNMELAPAERLNTSIEEAIAAGKDRCTVILSQAELTKLMADRAFEWETQQKRPNDPFFYGEWKNDGLHLVATYVSNAEGLKLYPRNEEDENSLLADYPGTHFNLTLIVEPSLNDRQLELKIKALKLGKIELPAGKITETVNQQLVNLEDSESYQNFLDKIITIRQLPDGNVELTLDPNKTSDMFRSAE